MSAIIRHAKPLDAAGIADVHVASWRTTYPGMLPDRYLVAMSERASRERWTRMLAVKSRSEGTYVAVDSSSRIVGFGCCGDQRSALDGYGGEFFAIYLFDYAQGQGLGRRLMAAMAENLMSRGVNSAVVWVLRDNPARWFYERLGGMRIAEHDISFAGSAVTETAYGWRDLAPLARLSAGPSLG